MAFIVYRVRNLLNGKLYVGKTNDQKRRWTEHLSESRRGDGRHLYNALRKYGADQFVMEPLSEHEGEEAAYAEEVRLIALHNTTNRRHGYNATTGGEGVRGLTPEGKARRSASLSARYKGAGNPFFGHKHTPETRAKIAETPRRKGSEHPLWGVSQSESTRVKISETKRAQGKHLSPEEKARLSALNRGERASKAKLTGAQVVALRAQSAAGVPTRALMAEFGLSKSSVCKIVKHDTYKDIVS